jgi:hypothetical protein
MIPRRNGDSITVTGTVAENFDVTRIQILTSAPVVNATNVPLPSPVVLTTGRFGPVVGNGDPNAEAYEGMLIRLNNVRVSSIDPVFSDPTEFEVDDGSGPMIVRRDGRNKYTNVPADTLTGKTLLKLNDRISSLTGVVYFSFNRYKIVPRTNADYGTVTSVDITHEPGVPVEYSIAQNYPNPFNPTTTIEYTLPATGFVTLKIYNVLGQEVRTLVNDRQESGRYTIRFDASSLASGMYLYRIESGKFIQSRKMLLLK